MRKITTLVVLFLLACSSLVAAVPKTCTWQGPSSNTTLPGTWGCTSGGPNAVPVNGDSIIIDVATPAAFNSPLTGLVSVTISGSAVISGSSNLGTASLVVTGTPSVTNLDIFATTATVTGLSLTVGATIAVSGAATFNTITMGGSSAITIGGAATLGGTWVASSAATLVLQSATLVAVVLPSSITVTCAAGVSIPTGATVTVNGPVAIAGASNLAAGALLTLGGAGTVSGITATATSVLSISGSTVTVSGADITGAINLAASASLTLGGTGRVASITMGAASLLTTSGTITISTSLIGSGLVAIAPSSTLNFCAGNSPASTAAWNVAGAVSLCASTPGGYSSGVWTVASGGELNFPAAVGFSLTLTSLTVNGGSVTCLASSPPAVTALTVTGTTLVSSGSLTLGGEVELAGPLLVSGGTMTVLPTATVGFSNAITVSGGILDVQTTTATASAESLTVSAGTFNIGFADFDVPTVSISGTGTVNVNMISLWSIQTLTMSGGVLNLLNSNGCSTNTAFTWNGGQISNGLFTSTFGIIMVGNGAGWGLNNATLVNSVRQISWSWTAASAFSCIDSTITNTQNLNMTTRTSFALATTGSGCTLANSGFLNATLGSGSASLNLNLQQAQMLLVSSGTLTLTGTSTLNQPVFVFGALQLLGGKHTISSTVLVSGTVTAGGTVEFQQAISLTGALATIGTSGGQTNYAGAISYDTNGATFQVSSGIANVNSDFNVSRVSITGGSMPPSGSSLWCTSVLITMTGGLLSFNNVNPILPTAVNIGGTATILCPNTVTLSASTMALQCVGSATCVFNAGWASSSMVSISSAAALTFVTTSSSVNITSLTVSGGVTSMSVVLPIANLFVTGGVFDMQTSMSVSGTFAWSNGQISSRTSATLTTGVSTSISGSGVLGSITLLMAGQVTWTASVSLMNTSQLTVGLTGVMNIPSGTTLQNGDSTQSQLINNGAILSQGTSLWTLTVMNLGNITVNSGSLSMCGTSTTEGQLAVVSPATLQFCGIGVLHTLSSSATVSVVGIVTVAGGATVQNKGMLLMTGTVNLQGVLTMQQSSTFSGSGSVSVSSGGQLTALGGRWALGPSSTLTVNNGTVLLTADVQVAFFANTVNVTASSSNMTLQASPIASFTINLLTTAGTTNFQFAPSSSFAIDVTTLVVSGGALVYSPSGPTGSMQLSAGSVTLGQALNITTALQWSGGSLAAGTGTPVPVTVSTSLTLSGNTKLLDSIVFVINAIATIQSGSAMVLLQSGSSIVNYGTVNVGSSLVATYTGIGVMGSWTNYGVFNKLAGPSQTNVSIPFINAGNVTVASGVLLFTVGVDNTGSMAVTAGGITVLGTQANNTGNVTMAAGTLTYSTTSFLNSGSIVAQTGLMSMQHSSWQNNGSLAMVNGNIAITADSSSNVGSLAINSGTIQANGTFFNNAGAITLTSATLQLSGATLLHTGAITSTGSSTVSLVYDSTTLAGLIGLNSGTCSLNGNALVATTVNQLLVYATATVNINASTISNQGAMWLKAGTLTVSGALTNGGNMTVLTGSLSVSGQVSNLANMTTTNGAITISGASLVNSGTVSIAGTGSMTVLSTTVMNVGFFATNSGNMVMSGFVNNNGLLSVGTGNMQLSGGSNSNGSYATTAASCVTTLSGTHQLSSSASIIGAGSLTFASGTATIAGMINMLSTTTVASGVQLTMTTGSNLFSGSVTATGTALVNGVFNVTVALTVSGTVQCTSTSVLDQLGSVLITGSGSFAASQFTPTNGRVRALNLQVTSGTFSAATSQSVTFSVSAAMSIDSGSVVLQFPGSVTTSTLALTSVSSSLQITPALLVQASFAWSGGTYTGPGELMVQGIATLSATSAKTITNGTLTLQTYGQWTGGNIVFADPSANITVAPAARLDISSVAGQMSLSSATTSGVLYNAGVVSTFFAPAVSTVTLAVQVLNTGTWNLQNGTVVYNGNVVNTGTVLMTTGAVSYNALWTHSGTFTASNGTVAINGVLTSSGSIALASGVTANFNSGSTATLSPGSSTSGSATVVFTGATCTGNGAYNITGSTLVQTGSIVNFGASSTVTLGASSLNIVNNATVTMAGTLSHSGLLHLATLSNLTLTSTAQLLAIGSIQLDNGGSAFYQPGLRATSLTTPSVLVNSGGLFSFLPGSSMTGALSITLLSVQGGNAAFNLGGTTSTPQAFLNGGSITLSSPITAQQLQWTNGNLQGSSIFSVPTTSSITGSLSKTLSQAQLQVSGTCTIDSTGTLFMLNGARIVNQAGSTMSITGPLISNTGSWSTANSNPRIENYATITVTRSSGSAFTLQSVNLINNGSVVLESGQLLLLGFVSSSQIITAAAQTLLQFGAGSYVTGNVSLDTNAQLQFVNAPSHLFTTSANVLGQSATLLVDTAPVVVQGPCNIGLSTTVQNSGLLSFGTQSLASLGPFPLNINSGGAIVVSGVFYHSGPSISLGTGLSSSSLSTLNFTSTSMVQQFSASSVFVSSLAQCNFQQGTRFMFSSLPLTLVNASGAFRFTPGVGGGAALSIAQLNVYGGTAHFNSDLNVLITNVLLGDGELRSDSVVNVTSGITWQAGMISGNGTLNSATNVNAGTSLTGNVKSISDVTFNIYGNLTFAATQNILINAYGNCQINVVNSTTSFATNTLITQVTSGGMMTLCGVVDITATTVNVGIGFTLCYESILLHSAGAATYGAAFINDGVYYMSASTNVTAVGPTAMTGALFIPQTARFTFAGNAVLSGTSLLQGAGNVYYTAGVFTTTGQYILSGDSYIQQSNVNWGDFFSQDVANITLEGDVHVDNGGQLNVVGVFLKTGGSLFCGTIGPQTAIVSFDPGASVYSLGSNLIIDAQGIFNFNSGTVEGVLSLQQLQLNGGSLHLSSGDLIAIYNQVVMNAGTLTLSNVMNIYGDLLWNSGTVIGGGITTVYGQMLMSTTGLKYIDTRTFVNTNTAVWSGGAVRFKNSALIKNNANATFTVTTAAGMSSFTGALSQFINAGLMTINTPQQTPLFNVQFVNSGTLNLISGTVTFSAGMQLTNGTFYLNNNTIISPTQPINVMSGALYGPGSIQGSLINNGNVRPSGNMYVSGYYAQQSNGQLIADVYGNFTWTRFYVSQAANLSGSLLVTFNNFFVPQLGSAFPVFFFGSRNGDWSVMRGCNGFLAAQYSDHAFTLLAIENPTGALGEVFVGELGSDASCCGSRTNPCGTIAFALETVLANNTVILLPGTFTGTQNRNLNFQNKPVTIAADVPGTAIVDCQSLGRFMSFTLGETASSVITGVTFQSCSASNGGALYIENSSPTIDGCYFLQNTATVNGAGIYVVGGASPSIQNCYFSGNSAPAGAGMFVDIGSSPRLTNNTFVLNNAAQTGGALMINQGFAQLSGNLWFNNSAPFGAAVYVSNAAPSIVSDSFMANRASSSGALYITLGSPTVRNTTFTRNQATLSGAGIYLLTSNANITDSLFVGNVAPIGAGVFAMTSSNGYFQRVRFVANSATQRGGGMTIQDSSPTVFLCTFTNNTSLQDAAGLYLTNSGQPTTPSTSPFLTTLTFTGNLATSGAGLYVDQFSTPTVFNCNITGNTASANGGGVLAFISSPIITDCTIMGNTAGALGGGAFAESTQFTLTNTLITQNVAPSGGGIYVTSGSTSLLRNCTVSNNNALQFGAGLYSAASTSITRGSIFVGNTAVQGGALYFVQSNSTVENTRVVSNSATQQGGAMYSVASTVLVQGSQVDGNTAGQSGGGGQIIASVVSVVASNISTNNAASGGGFFVDSSAFTLTDSTTYACTAFEGGGVFAVLSTVNIVGGLLLRNSVVQRGGGVYCLGGVGFSIYNTLWVSNTGDAGGALFSDNCAPLISGANFTSNSATSGGAIGCVSSAAPNLINCAMTSNVASQGGGAVSCIGCQSLVVTGGIFQNNAASSNGGGAVLLSGTLGTAVVTGAQFVSNVAFNSSGGALTVTTTAISVQGGLFASNQAAAGGAMFLSCATVGLCNVTNVAFAGNSALTGGGGAMFWDNQSPTLLSNINNGGNQAIYGPFVASSPKQLLFSQSFNTSVASGQQFPVSVVVAVQDFYGQTVSTDFNTIVEAKLVQTGNVSAEQGSVQGSAAAPAIGGLAVFSSLSIIGPPGNNFLMEFSANALTPVSLVVRVRACVIGEKLENRVFCTLCPQNTFNLDGDLQCQNCPTEGASCVGGSVVNSTIGYWLLFSPNSSYATSVTPYVCPDGFCLANNLCAPNRYGPLCGTCAPDFYAWGASCSFCPGVNVLVVVALMIGVFGYVLFVLKFGRNSSGNVKIFMYFVQTLEIVVGPTSKWLPFSSIFNFQVDAGGNSLCIAPLDFYQRSLAYVLLPIILILALIATYVIQSLWRRLRCNDRLGITNLRNKWRARQARKLKEKERQRGEDSDDMLNTDILPAGRPMPKVTSQESETERMQRKMAELKNAYIHAFVFLVLFSYSTITLNTLQFINCRTVGTMRLVATSPDIDCTAGAYHSWSVLYYLLLGLWVIGGPILLIIFLWRVRLNLQSDLYRNRFGALYVSYRPGAFWWETVFVTRRTLLIGLYVALYDAPFSRTFALAFACVAICALHIGVRPFLTATGNFMESASLVSLSLIAIIEASTFASTQEDSNKDIFTAILVFLPAAFILLVIVFRFAEPVIQQLRLRAQKRILDALAPIFRRETDDPMVGAVNPAFVSRDYAPAPSTQANPLYSSRTTRTTAAMRPNPLFGKGQEISRGTVKMNPLRRATTNSSTNLLSRMDSTGSTSPLVRRDSIALSPQQRRDSIVSSLASPLSSANLLGSPTSASSQANVSLSRAQPAPLPNPPARPPAQQFNYDDL